jgi:hypothetical protein
MQTKLIRVDLANNDLATVVRSDPQNGIPGGANASPLETHVNDICQTQSATNFKLISTFVFGTNLVLIFQN